MLYTPSGIKVLIRHILELKAAGLTPATYNLEQMLPSSCRQDFTYFLQRIRQQEGITTDLPPNDAWPAQEVDRGLLDYLELNSRQFSAVKLAVRSTTAGPYPQAGFVIKQMAVKFGGHNDKFFAIELEFSVHRSDGNFYRFLQHTFEADALAGGLMFDYDLLNNTFSYRAYVTTTKTTLGLLAELEDLKAGVITPNYRFIPSTYLYRCIETLQCFWD